MGCSQETRMLTAVSTSRMPRTVCVEVARDSMTVSGVRFQYFALRFGFGSVV